MILIVFTFGLCGKAGRVETANYRNRNEIYWPDIECQIITKQDKIMKEISKAFRKSTRIPRCRSASKIIPQISQGKYPLDNSNVHNLRNICEQRQQTPSNSVISLFGGRHIIRLWRPSELKFSCVTSIVGVITQKHYKFSLGHFIGRLTHCWLFFQVFWLPLVNRQISDSCDDSI